MPAFADDGSTATTVDSYITWEFLGTMSGVTAAVLLIVQFIKAPLDKVWKVPTRFIVYFISVILLFIIEYVSKGLITFDRVCLILLNAIIVTVAAMGSYEATFHKLEANKTNLSFN
jgi:hypothetical protein